MPILVIALSKTKFPLGQVVITANAEASLDPADVQQGLSPPRQRRLGRSLPRRRPHQRRRPQARRPADVGLRPGRPAVLDHHRVGPLGDNRADARGLLTNRAGFGPPSFHGDVMKSQSVYDNYEISGCHRLDEDEKYGRQFVQTCDDAEAQFWTLYGHINGEGVEAIGNFSRREAAEQVFYRITGQPFTGSYRADTRLRLMHAAPALLEALKSLADQADEALPGGIPQQAFHRGPRHRPRSHRRRDEHPSDGPLAARNHRRRIRRPVPAAHQSSQPERELGLRQRRRLPVRDLWRRAGIRAATGPAHRLDAGRWRRRRPVPRERVSFRQPDRLPGQHGAVAGGSWISRFASPMRMRTMPETDDAGEA